MAVHTSMEREGDVTLEQIAAAIGALGTLGFGGAFVTGVFGRRKNKADAAAILTQAAAGLVEPFRNELAETRRELGETRRELGETKRELGETKRELSEHQRRDAEREQNRRAAAARHIAWDSDVARRLRDLGQPVADPPTLE
ncbi:hypothetical protein IU501_34755 [Nocardia otitidiscaviarum]|uniref:hypothetical protein n=1 Tax=Nocardia otitidiscaviarum TaxID=1823 RepID=UPI0018947B68|nr:hypothetical protein [Nocardia otitidiscaviarum]MBF6138132.1 hypothetical protein [Nocardia otitidiscaviarum]